MPRLESHPLKQTSTVSLCFLALCLYTHGLSARIRNLAFAAFLQDELRWKNSMSASWYVSGVGKGRNSP